MPADGGLHVDRAPLEEMISRVSHDLKAPIRALAQIPEWIRDDLAEAEISLPPLTEELLTILQSRASRLEMMLDALAVYSSAALDKPVPVDTRASVAAALTSRALEGRVRLRSRLARASVLAGASDLKTAVNVLLDNAIGHNPNTVRICVLSRIAFPWWELLVRDDGRGIPPERHEEVFRPMVALMSRDDREAAGMGLATLRKIAEARGGSAEIIDTRERGFGTTVRFRLPLLVDEESS